MTLLQKRDATRKQRRLEAYAETRHRLKQALAQLIPGQTVWLFGSLTKPGTFNDCSDVDLAFEVEPIGVRTLELISELSERLDRPVDVVSLATCRFRDKIVREGERWIA